MIMGHSKHELCTKTMLYTLQQIVIHKGTPPYGHLGNMVTSLLRPLFMTAQQKRPYIFL